MRFLFYGDLQHIRTYFYEYMTGADILLVKLQYQDTSLRHQTLQRNLTVAVWAEQLQLQQGQRKAEDKRIKLCWQL